MKHLLKHLPNMLKKTTVFWIFSVLLLFAACDEKKPQVQPVQFDIRPLDEIPGIFEAHGVIGTGTSMNVLEFVSDNNDTLYVKVNNQAVMGGVKVGDEVKSGQKVAVLEAMKMENDIPSEYSGVVRQILVAEGDTLQEGQAMFIVE